MSEQKRHEEARSPRERLARMRRLVRRSLGYWKGSVLVLLVAGGLAAVGSSKIKEVYRSECTVIAKPRIRTDDRDDSSSSPDQLARQSARLKDMLTTRGRLESAIKRFGLYPETVAGKTMLDAVEQMKPHVGFRSLEGAQYVISVDGDAPATVQAVTDYLAESLIGDYAANDLDDLKREADFLGLEEQRALANLEDATRAVTVFLAAHPEFAVEARQAASTPFGPSPAAGIPLLPRLPREAAENDPELSALLRERMRLEGEARGAAATAKGPTTPAMGPGRPLDDQLGQAQADAELAAKRVAETQADLASKSNLTEDHPDMRAARMAAESSARQLHQARVKLASLQQIRVGGSGMSPGAGAMLPDEISQKLRQVDAQITTHRGQVARAQANRSMGDSQSSGSPSPLVAAVVALETDWQRMLRALNDAKLHHEDLKLRVERAKLALEAARAQANERMAVVEPPVRPTHPSRGARTNVAIAGAAMAWLLALAYATARASMDDTLVDADDIEALGVAPVLGVVPRSTRTPRTKEARTHATA
jgi:hypothetical protein